MIRRSPTGMGAVVFGDVTTNKRGRDRGSGYGLVLAGDGSGRPATPKALAKTSGVARSASELIHPYN